MVPGLELATQLVLDLCGGTASEVTLAGEVPRELRVIDFPVTEVKRLCGIDPAVADVVAILEKHGFACKEDRAHGRVQVTVPSWRPNGPHIRKPKKASKNVTVLPGRGSRRSLRSRNASPL